jgi:uncharacterized protein
MGEDVAPSSPAASRLCLGLAKPCRDSNTLHSVRGPSLTETERVNGRPNEGWTELVNRLKPNENTAGREEALRCVAGYVQGILGSDPGGHDWWHAQRVARCSLEIARHEGADVPLCVLAAAVHDVIDAKLVDDEEMATKRLRGWLEDRGLDRRDVEHVLGIARTLSFRGGCGPAMSSLEGEVVQDADRLDSLGAIGLARTLAFGGTIGRPLHEPGVPPRFGMSAEEYRAHLSTSINHIRERLLVLSERLNTAYARELAQEREAYVIGFLERFEDEWHGRR